MDKVLNKVGLGAALFFMVAELTYLNAKSLLFLTGNETVDKVFAVVGAFAFSIVTVVVMRKKTKGLVKMVFPWFDAALMFLGLNLKYADQIIAGTDNPLRLSLTVFMALLAGLTTYSLGIINYKEHESDFAAIKSDFAKTESDFAENQSDFAKLKSDFAKQESDFANCKSELAKTKSDFAKMKSDFAKQAEQLEQYRSAYMAAERSRILKKKPENRTEKEQALLAESETI
jgi:hypothetical protein